MLPDKPKLDVLEVKCLNNFEIEPNPRSKCWKVTVPYSFRELMELDELYPSGWSHRKFFPPRKNQQNQQQQNQQQPKRPNLDPIAAILENGRAGTPGHSVSAGTGQSMDC